MTDLLSAFLLKAANDCIGDEVFVLEEEPELCDGCVAGCDGCMDEDRIAEERLEAADRGAWRSL